MGAGHGADIRLRLLNFVVMASAAALAARLVYLQVFEGPHLAALALEQRTRAIDLTPVRGEIVDRKGRDLAISVDAYSISAQPGSFDRPLDQVTEALAPVLHMAPGEIARRLGGVGWRWVVRGEDEPVGAEIRALHLPGIEVIRESRRVYPNGPLASTLLGFVGADDHGLAGIEHDFDRVLAGSAKRLYIQVDAYGHELLREGTVSPLRTIQTDAARVVLTLDEDVQALAERELDAEVAKEKARRGAVIVMDPRDGDILAYATSPSYDPNHFEGVPWDRIANWPAIDVYEPGSTMKIFTAAAALETGVIHPDEMVVCPPAIHVGDRIISDHDATQTRVLDLGGILQVSSNVGAAEVGTRMTDSEHDAILHRFGFGQVTGSGLGGESPGLVPPLPWSPVRHATICFGQGIAVTPLQMVTAACAVANGGREEPPRLISEVVSPQGQVLRRFEVPPPRQVVSERTAYTVRHLLERVVEAGTGVEARIPGYVIAGKTGTAQRPRTHGRGYGENVVSSFIGIVPANDPQLVILTLLDSPQVDHFASVTAVPLFRRVAEGTLRELGIGPQEAASGSPTFATALDQD